MTAPSGRKFDDGKLQPRLLHEGMPRALSELVEVLTFGAQKYDAHNWLNVENGIERYQDASYRHDNLRAQGELCDQESGLRHRAHHIVNELFVLELELRAVEESLATRVVSQRKAEPEEKTLLGWRILHHGLVSAYNAPGFGAFPVEGPVGALPLGTSYLFATKEIADIALAHIQRVALGRAAMGAYTVVPVYAEEQPHE